MILTLTAWAADNMKAFPPAEAGMVRHVLELPKQEDETSFKVELIAGKTVRAVLDAAGVKNVLSKSLGSKNPANVVKATIGALRSLRRREQIYQDRGLPMRKPETPVAV